MLSPRIRKAFHTAARYLIDHTRIATAIVAAVFVVVAFVLLGDPLGKRSTFGLIWLDSPEIYTRERLVNDRFVQDAWLTRQLQKSDGARDSLQILEDQRVVKIGSGNGDTGPSSDGSEAKAGLSRPSVSRQPTDPTTAPSSHMQLMIENDFRDVVRNLIIENQLDDRHDLNGNSLYMLKFNASVLPGGNTQATALVTIQLTGPELLSPPPRSSALAATNTLAQLGTEDQIAAWRVVYSRWIDNLRSRLNQAHKELKQAYSSNEFSHNDYSRLVGFLSRNLHMSALSLPQCPEALITIHGQEGEPLQLRPADHAARKACVHAMVRKAIERPAPPDAGSGVYIAGTETRGTEAPRSHSLPLTQVIDIQEARVMQELNRLLNAFFATKTVQLVLGISLPESSFIRGTFYDLPALKQLIELSFFGSDEGADEGNAFAVREKTFSVIALDPARVSTDAFPGFVKTTAALRNREFADFVTPRFQTPRKKMLVSDADLSKIRGEKYSLSEADFAQLKDVEGVYEATAEVGLLNFARKARANVRAFTYSVSPKERGDTIMSSLESDSQVQAAWGQAGKNSDQATSAFRRESLARSTQRRGAIVGFGQPTADPAKAEFGWMISPRQIASDGQRIVYVQAPAQHSLSALVSLPAWWNEVNLHVSTAWIGSDGKVVSEGSQTLRYSIELPTDFEPLETTLLEVQQLGPELMESRLDPVRLTACKEGAIVIPGRRLWRSTRVTLGYQIADEIAMLPNMKGIIAKFQPVQSQVSLSEAEEWRANRKNGPIEIRRAVRVWTSQGTITLPSPARIGIPSDCEEKKSKS